MRIKLLFASLCVCFFAGAALAQGDAAPRFRDYAAPAYKGRAAAKFERGSRLIVMSGYPTGERDKPEPEKGLYYYEWDGGDLRLLRFVEKNEGC